MPFIDGARWDDITHWWNKCAAESKAYSLGLEAELSMSTNLKWKERDIDIVFPHNAEVASKIGQLKSLLDYMSSIGLTSRSQLILDNTDISDAELLQLATPQLKCIAVINTPVTEAGIQEFQKRSKTPAVRVRPKITPKESIR